MALGRARVTQARQKEDKMSFLVSIGLWLLKFASSPTVKALIQQVVNDMAQVGKDELNLVIKAVKDANARTDLTGSQKFDLVVETVKASLPNIPASLLNRLIENAYGALSLLPPTT